MKASEILRAAKARLTPETWPSKEGVQIALARATIGNPYGLYADALLGRYADALFVFGRVVASGCWAGYNISAWNDAPERTLQDVHAAFDAAIAIAEEREAVEREDALVTS